MTPNMSPALPETDTSLQACIQLYSLQSCFATVDENTKSKFVALQGFAYLSS